MDVLRLPLRQYSLCWHRDTLYFFFFFLRAHVCACTVQHGIGTINALILLLLLVTGGGSTFVTGAVLWGIGLLYGCYPVNGAVRGEENSLFDVQLTLEVGKNVPNDQRQCGVAMPDVHHVNMVTRSANEAIYTR